MMLGWYSYVHQRSPQEMKSIVSALPSHGMYFWHEMISFIPVEHLMENGIRCAEATSLVDFHHIFSSPLTFISCMVNGRNAPYLSRSLHINIYCIKSRMNIHSSGKILGNFSCSFADYPLLQYCEI